MTTTGAASARSAVNGAESAFCATCRTPIPVTHGRHYCSDRCRLLAWAGRHTPAQTSLDWSPRVPPPVDPNAAAPVRRRALSYNRKLLARLLEGTSVLTNEAEVIAGKRAAARIHDIRVWLRNHGYQGQDPVPVMAVDREARVFSWRLTGAALELARSLST